MKSTRRRIRISLFVLVGLVVVFSGLFWTLRSDAFLRSVVLPRLSRAAGMDIQAAEIDWAPFSRLTVRDGSVRAEDRGMDLDFEELGVHYDFRDLLRGVFTVHEAVLRRPVLEVRPSERSADRPDSSADRPEPSADDTAPRLNLANLRVENGVLLFPGPDGSGPRIEGTLAVSEIRNGGDLELDLDSAFTWTPAGGSDPEPSSGSFGARLRVHLSEALVPTDVQGRLEASLDPTALVPEAVRLEFETAMGLSPREKRVDLRALSARGWIGEREWLALTLSDPAKLDLSRPLLPLASDTRVRLTIPERSLSDLPLPSAFPLRQGVFQAEAALEASEGGRRVEGSLRVRARQVSGRVGGLSLDNWGGEVTAEFTGDPGRVDIKRLRADWPAEGDFDNVLDAEGYLDFSSPRALRGRLALRGDAVDLSPWLPQPADPSAAVPEEGATPGGDDAPLSSGTPWPVETFTASLDLERLGLADMDLRAIRARAELGPRALTVPELSLRINQAPFTAEGFLDLGETPPAYRFRGDLGALDLGPVVDPFLPAVRRETLIGTVKGRFDVEGRGWTAPDIRDHLAGDGEVHLTEGRIFLLEDGHPGLRPLKRVGRRLLHTAARALRIPPDHLSAPPLREVDVSVSVKDGMVELKRLRAVNREMLLSTRGTVELAETFAAARFRPLPVTLGVSSNVAERARVYREDRVRGDHVVLPPFLEVTGTLADPEIDWDKSVLVGLVASGVSERVDVGDDRTREALGLIGGLLSGEAPPPTPTPEPPAPGATPEPTKKPDRTDRVLQGLRLFQKLRDRGDE